MENKQKNKAKKVSKTTKSAVKTETPLAEKDEVKQAEDNQRKRN